MGITLIESEKIKKHQKALDKVIKLRYRYMIMGYEIKKKMEKSFKRTIIMADVFEHFLEKN